ncbi:LIM domain-containing protein [Zalerion maritima]|uniref:LIM domain-containing protein n=1 Tax=Zalerion maritima TaxID=339359 RepID=A0AAD5S3H7_9PEZI|nr:LIM domain-containing protein [Zalerion maritima]
MVVKAQSKEPKARKVTPPSPSYMSSDQFASYLTELRKNRVARPGGARPYPGSISSRHSTVPAGPAGSASLATTARPEEEPEASSSSGHQRTTSDESKLPSAPYRFAARSMSSRHSATPAHQAAGHDYFPADQTPPIDLGNVVPSATYIERGQRWMEKEEALSLRQALEDLDMSKKADSNNKTPARDEDEARIHEAALDEAAELVWQHQNDYKPPAPGTPYKYKHHLRKNSYAHARTASIGPNSGDVVSTGLGRDFPRSVSGSSSGSDQRVSFEHPTRSSLDSNGSRKPRAPTSNIVSTKNRRRSSMKRNISGEVERPFSGDQIWEEPDGQSSENTSKRSKFNKSRPSLESKGQGPVLQDAPRNPLNRPGGTATDQAEAPAASGTGSTRRPLPWLANRNKRLEKTEIHRNPPSQSRNPGYTKNTPVDRISLEEEGSTAKNNGMEVRGEDIIQATSMRLKDRSAKLPTPTAVSDSPGRPIVSFDAKWKGPEEDADVKIEKEKAARNGSSSFSQQKQHPTNAPSIQVAQSNKAVGRAPASPSPQLPFIRVACDSSTRDADTGKTFGAGESGPGSIARRGIFSRGPSSAPFSTPIASSHAPSTSATIPKINLPPADEESSKTHISPPPPIPTIVTPDDYQEGSNDMHSCQSSSWQDTRPLPQTSISTENDGASNAPAAPPIPVMAAPDDGHDGDSNNRNSKPSLRSSRPLPTPTKRGSPAGLHRHRGHWSPAAARNNPCATATCHECQLPIEGRFVALSGVGERFHPQCFRCYSCGTGLEALEISPEPDERRAERLERIRRRARGEVLAEEEGNTAAEDGDERLRFFCHLDWHELYAPRCKHCTTPILGEHIVALGEHWHYGHFFCAECGDPFEQGMTHIEKDGYAWCINCQTKRTERRAPKCKKCKKAVIGQYVRAMGGEWHDECFRCATCHGGFDDGQIFPKKLEVNGDILAVCTKCRQLELRA